MLRAVIAEHPWSETAPLDPFSMTAWRQTAAPGITSLRGARSTRIAISVEDEAIIPAAVAVPVAYRHA